MRRTLADKQQYFAPSPTYQRIEESLRTRVRDGYWPAGAMLPGRRSLAKEYGVAIGTVQRAIANMLADGTLLADGPQGTFVAETPVATANPAVISSNGFPGIVHDFHKPPSVDSLRIAVVLGRKTLQSPDEESLSANLFFGPLYSGIRAGLTGTGVDVNYVQGDGDDYQAIYEDGGQDGLIIVAPMSQELRAMRNLSADGIPYVAVAISSDAAPEDAALPCVDTDNRQGAYDAVKHLLDLGHSAIAIVNLAGSHANHHDRLEGYLQALGDSGAQVTPDNLVLYPVYEEAAFEARVEEWISRVKSRGTLPTAVFACDFMMALVTLGALRRHGLRVPEDISIVGFDDNVAASHLNPPLTTVRVPVHQMGARSAHRLVEFLRDRTGKMRLTGTEKLPNQLIVRGSTCPPK